jgi:peroxiredoxin family protein
MNPKTRAAGFIVLAVTEGLIIAAAITNRAELPALVGSQVIVFVTVWGTPALKNVVDMRRDIRSATRPERRPPDPEPTPMGD